MIQICICRFTMYYGKCKLSQSLSLLFDYIFVCVVLLVATLLSYVVLQYWICISIYLYLFIRHTPSYEYYVPGSPQHAIKVRVKNKADRENRIKVHSVSVLNSRNKEKVRIKTVLYTFMV